MFLGTNGSNEKSEIKQFENEIWWEVFFEGADYKHEFFLGVQNC